MNLIARKVRHLKRRTPTADEKKRVVVRSPPRKKSRAEVRAAIKASKMKPLASWDQLKTLTRDL